MLNLVQLQERLKDMPMQVVMEYANGKNPQVPPFLALGELNRRKQAQQAAAAEQAQQMEGAPTVKEQIEQQTGLMALQSQKQRAGMMQLAQQAGQAPSMPMPQAPQAPQGQPPVQMAGGGLAQMPGLNPDMLKKLMMLIAMKKRGGVDTLPMRADMFSRDDYAKGGIVAFAGDTNGSFVETDDNFYQLESEVPKDEEEIDPAKVVAEILRRRAGRKPLEERRAEAGLPSIAPDTTARTREDLARREREAKESDTVINRILALKPGRFASGETAASVVAYEQQKAAKMDDIKKLKAAAEDQRTAAEAAFKEGRFKEGEADLANADKFDLEAAEKLSSVNRNLAQARQAEAGKQTNLTFINNAILEYRKNPTPENKVKMDAAIEAARYVTPLTGEALATRRELGFGGIEVDKDKAFTEARDKIIKEYKTQILMAETPKDKAEAEAKRDAEIAEARSRIYGGQASPAPKAGGAARTKPNISGIKGAPSGSTVGNYVEGKGWEIRGQDGKLLGYAKG